MWACLLVLASVWKISQQSHHIQSQVCPLPPTSEIEEMTEELDHEGGCINGECPGSNSVRQWYDPTHYTKLTLPEETEEWWWDVGNRCKADSRSQRALRKEIRQMSRSEWMRYSKAIINMANNIPPGSAISEYHMFVELHTFSTAPGGHFGAAWLVWHREFSARFEEALQDNDPFSGYGYLGPIAIPYWDNLLDDGLPQPLHSVLWTEELFGDIDGPVVTGPFANFPISSSCGPNLSRAGKDIPGLLFTDIGLQQIVFNKMFYRELVCFIDCRFNAADNWVRFFVGGQLFAINCAVSDPMFWSHSTFIDLIWEEFRQTTQTSDITFEYPSSSEYNIGNPAAHEADAPMLPFAPLINRDGLSEHYTRDLYTYTPRPSSITCNYDTDCKGRLLWCRTETQKCVTKIQEGGLCSYTDEVSIPGTENRCHCTSRNEEASCEPDGTSGNFVCVCTATRSYYHY